MVFYNEAKVAVRSRESAPAECPGALGRAAAPAGTQLEGPRGEAGRPGGGMSPLGKGLGIFLTRELQLAGKG